MGKPNGKNANGRRLPVDERREQLLSVAAEVFASVPYEEAQIEDIAGRAGVSASLIYYYFPNKRALFAAVVDLAIEELGRMSAPGPPELPPLERIAIGIDGYIDYVQRYEHAYRAMHRGREAGTVEVREAIERNTQRQINRFKEVLNVPVDNRIDLALRGGLALTIAMCLDWLDRRQISRDDLRELLVGCYVGLATAILGDQAQVLTRVST